MLAEWITKNLSAKTEMDVYELILLLSLSVTVNSVQGELGFKGNGFQVYYISFAKEHMNSYEFKLWFRTRQVTGMLMMIQNGVGSYTLVEMFDGRLR